MTRDVAAVAAGVETFLSVVHLEKKKMSFRKVVGK
jgi:hypothetical protein